MTDIEVPNDAVDMDSWASSACIPRVPFISLSDGPPTWDHRSLWPSFDSARLVSLAVRLAYAIALDERFPTALSQPSRASVTIWEATAPVKLPNPRMVLDPDDETAVRHQ